MKKTFILVFGISAAVVLSSCKSRESAFAKAYEKAKTEETANVFNEVQNVTTSVVNDANSYAERPTQTVVVEESNIASSRVNNDDAEYANVAVRTIDADVSVVSGGALKAYSVVVGSFISKTNAEGLRSKLIKNGYDSRVVYTNETINGNTGWYRVIATSSDSKADAARSRNALKDAYPGAWLLRR